MKYKCFHGGTECFTYNSSTYITRSRSGTVPPNLQASMGGGGNGNGGGGGVRCHSREPSAAAAASVVQHNGQPGCAAAAAAASGQRHRNHHHSLMGERWGSGFHCFILVYLGDYFCNFCQVSVSLPPQRLRDCSGLSIALLFYLPGKPSL